MTAARMAEVYEAHRLYCAKLSWDAYQAGDLDTTRTLGDEARRAGNIARALLLV